MTAKRSVFRTQALRYYAQSNEKDTLPHFIRPPVFLLLWLLLGLLALILLLAWQGQVPTFTNAMGTFIPAHTSDEHMTALLFIPYHPSIQVKTGQPVTIQVQLTGQSFESHITTVEPGIIKPADALRRYNLTGDLQFIISEPSIVAMAQLDTTPDMQQLQNCSASARVQTGSIQALTLLTNLLKNIFRS